MESLCDKWLRNYYGNIPFEDYSLLDRAVRTLQANSGGLRMNQSLPWKPFRGIKPSDCYFNGVWNWDCAFHAMGTALWDPELARDQIRIFQKIQQTDGMYPDVWWAKDGSVFAGGSKPPIFPWAALIIENVEHNRDFLVSAYESFLKNEQFWLKKRGGEKYGLFHYDGNSNNPDERQLWGGWESGWDDSPRWDYGINNIFPVDLNCYMVIFYRSLAEIARRLNLHDDTEKWQRKETFLSERIESKLWSDEQGCYLDYDYMNNKFQPTVTPASYMPMFIGNASIERAEKMASIAREHLHPGWPSVSYNDTDYDPMGYWRGRTWLNIAYFALKGLKDYGFYDLADEGRKTILSWVRRDPGSIYENYNSHTGMPAGVPHFSWSAVFVIKFLIEWETPA